MTTDLAFTGLPVGHRLDTPTDTLDGPNRQQCACGLAPEDRPGQAYNEEAFRHFLGVERKRSERSGRPFLLVRVDLKEHPGVSAHIGPPVAHKLFAALGRCVRETDFIGWYRHERVVGAVLVEFRDGARAEVSSRVRYRVIAALDECLSATVARRLQVRVHQHPSPERNDSGDPDAGAALIPGEI